MDQESVENAHGEGFKASAAYRCNRLALRPTCVACATTPMQDENLPMSFDDIIDRRGKNCSKWDMLPGMFDVALRRRAGHVGSRFQDYKTDHV